METISIKTHRRSELLDITHQISEIVAGSGVRQGTVTVYVTHTTAGVTINENADPSVVHDMLLSLEELLPHHNKGYRHAEGNSDAHIKASLIGSSVTVFVEDGQLLLGTWQGIYFCEFDGPRHRNCLVKIVEG